MDDMEDDARSPHNPQGVSQLFSYRYSANNEDGEVVEEQEEEIEDIIGLRNHQNGGHRGRD